MSLSGYSVIDYNSRSSSVIAQSDDEVDGGPSSFVLLHGPSKVVHTCSTTSLQGSCPLHVNSNDEASQQEDSVVDDGASVSVDQDSQKADTILDGLCVWPSRESDSGLGPDTPSPHLLGPSDTTPTTLLTSLHTATPTDVPSPTAISAAPRLIPVKWAARGSSSATESPAANTTFSFPTTSPATSTAMTNPLPSSPALSPGTNSNNATSDLGQTGKLSSHPLPFNIGEDLTTSDGGASDIHLPDATDHGKAREDAGGAVAPLAHGSVLSDEGAIVGHVGQSHIERTAPCGDDSMLKEQVEQAPPETECKMENAQAETECTGKVENADFGTGCTGNMENAGLGIKLEQVEPQTECTGSTEQVEPETECTGNVEQVEPETEGKVEETQNPTDEAGADQSNDVKNEHVDEFGDSDAGGGDEDEGNGDGLLGLLAQLDEATLSALPPALVAMMQQLEAERDELAGRLLESDAELSTMRTRYQQLAHSHASCRTWLHQLLADQLEGVGVGQEGPAPGVRRSPRGSPQPALGSPIMPDGVSGNPVLLDGDTGACSTPGQAVAPPHAAAAVSDLSAGPASVSDQSSCDKEEEEHKQEEEAEAVSGQQDQVECGTAPVAGLAVSDRMAAGVVGGCGNRQHEEADMEEEEVGESPVEAKAAEEAAAVRDGCRVAEEADAMEGEESVNGEGGAGRQGSGMEAAQVGVVGGQPAACAAAAEEGKTDTHEGSGHIPGGMESRGGAPATAGSVTCTVAATAPAVVRQTGTWMYEKSQEVMRHVPPAWRSHALAARTAALCQDAADVMQSYAIRTADAAAAAAAASQPAVQHVAGTACALWREAAVGTAAAVTAIQPELVRLYERADVARRNAVESLPGLVSAAHAYAHTVRGCMIAQLHNLQDFVGPNRPNQFRNGLSLPNRRKFLLLLMALLILVGGLGLGTLMRSAPVPSSSVGVRMSGRDVRADRSPADVPRDGGGGSDVHVQYDNTVIVGGTGKAGQGGEEVGADGGCGDQTCRTIGGYGNDGDAITGNTGAASAAAEGALYGILLTDPYDTVAQELPACAALSRLAQALCWTWEHPTTTHGEGLQYDSSAAATGRTDALCSSASTATGLYGTMPRGVAVRLAMEELSVRWQLVKDRLNRSSTAATEADVRRGRRTCDDVNVFVSDGDTKPWLQQAGRVVSAWAVAHWMPTLQPLLRSVAEDEELPHAVTTAHKVVALANRLCSETGRDPTNTSTTATPSALGARLHAALSEMGALAAVHVDASYPDGAAAAEMGLRSASQCLEWQEAAVAAAAEQQHQRAECRRRCSPMARLEAAMRTLGLPKHLLPPSELFPRRHQHSGLRHNDSPRSQKPPPSTAGGGGGDCGGGRSGREGASGIPTSSPFYDATAHDDWVGLLSTSHLKERLQELLTSSMEAAATAAGGGGGGGLSGWQQAVLQAAGGAAAAAGRAAREAASAVSRELSHSDWGQDFARWTGGVTAEAQRLWRHTHGAERAAEQLMEAVRGAYQRQWQALRCECGEGRLGCGGLGAAATAAAAEGLVNGTSSVGPMCERKLEALLRAVEKAVEGRWGGEEGAGGNGCGGGSVGHGAIDPRDGEAYARYPREAHRRWPGRRDGDCQRHTGACGRSGGSSSGRGAVGGVDWDAGRGGGGVGRFQYFHRHKPHYHRSQQQRWQEEEERAGKQDVGGLARDGGGGHGSEYGADVEELLRAVGMSLQRLRGEVDELGMAVGAVRRRCMGAVRGLATYRRQVQQGAV